MISLEKLEIFEKSINPAFIEKSDIPVRIIGYGEISTVFSIVDPEKSVKEKPIACKRMPLFSDRSSAENYARNYEEYCRLLRKAGLMLPKDRTEIVIIQNRPVIFYILQELFPSENFCHNLLHTLETDLIEKMINRIVNEISKVWAFNESKTQGRKLAIDGQLSNWVMIGDIVGGELFYIDTSTPLYQVENSEQLDPELFLQSAPSFLRWIIRWLFLKDVMNRYYDPRLVYMDLAANLFKEQRSDLVPVAIEIINGKLNRKFESLTIEEVEKYYKEDKFIWKLFLAFRKLDRWIKTKLLNQQYEFILPGKIMR